MIGPTLTGQRVVLRPVSDEDRARRQRLGWHASIERNYGHRCTDRAMTEDEARDWLESVRAAERDPTKRHWVIETQARLIGVTFLHSISPSDRKARFAIGLFDPDDVGHGFGSEATRLVLRYAFTGMDLNRVDLRVLAFNEDAIRAYEACGFIVEGRERESCWLDGTAHDDIIMGILATDLRSADPT